MQMSSASYSRSILLTKICKEEEYEKNSSMELNSAIRILYGVYEL
jgi:hypothetical protein